jgi:hypothetical protein
MWSKIVLPNIPCRAQELDRDMNEQMMEDNALWTTQQIEYELRKNPLFQNLVFTRTPDWTTPRDKFPLSATRGTIILNFEDPDGSIAKNIVDQREFRTYMFASPIYPRTWKEKVKLDQCPRCWTLDAHHDRCTEVCRICASTKHVEKDHNMACMACHTQFGIQKVSEPSHICPHIRCKNCGKDHPANDESCKARASEIQQIRANGGRRGRGNRLPPNQPILDLTGETTSRNVPLRFAPNDPRYYSGPRVAEQPQVQSTDGHPQPVLP